MDLSERSLVRARLRANSNKARLRGSILFCQADCERLPIRDRAFDVIYALGSFSYLDRDAAYAELARTLRPDGTAFIVDTLGHNPLLNLWRWLDVKRGTRSRWQVGRTMRMEDIRTARTYFDELGRGVLRLPDLAARASLSFILRLV